ncbi:hypothetical protein [Nannocystis sp. SCPEA4]|uniref:hypothetical protein n=1 Tax=Nannocystis sp. SCPEA4 TaxID=2996787 RepID=UPI00226F655F|nr:hypothetical protein [Nannocystis sp. SCPEA4]MCY1055152.1 hypothetical protein [Nannocystis sp. SCPEA4]
MYTRTWLLGLMVMVGCGDDSEPLVTVTETATETTTTTGTPGTDGATSTGGGTTQGGSHECGSLLANNDENCVCLPGYERCEPGGESTDCCEKQGMGDGECPDPNSENVDGQCFCKINYTWCAPDDPIDLSCCFDPGQSTATPTEGTGATTEGTTTEGTSGGDMCPGAVGPPASCDEDVESFFCTHPAACGPAGSTAYFCQGGVWVEDTTLDQTCQLDGHDFAYGCVDDGSGVSIECGSGSGAACEGEEASCLDDKTWAGCKWGKTSVTDCFVACTEVGDGMGATYDYGSCAIQDGEAVCACCDAGDEGCPI